MSSAVEAISCPKVDVPAGPEPGEPAKEAAPPAEHCDTAPNGKCAPRCHGEEEADEDEDEEEEEKAPKAIDLGPMVSIKEQLEKDKVRALAARHSLQPPAIDAKLLSRRGASSILKRVSYSLGWCV